MTKYDDIPLPFNSTAPLPTRRPTNSRGGGGGGGGGSSSAPGPGRSTTLKRGKTLTRPERHVAPAPLVAAPPTQSSSTPLPFSATSSNNGGSLDWWKLWSYATTFWAPPVVLGWFGIKEKQSRQAWREKVTLCWIALLLGGIVGFVTLGLQRALCPEKEANTGVYERLGQDDLTLSINGWVFNISSSLTQETVDFYALSKQMPGQDITNLFTRAVTDYPSCSASARYATTPLCKPSGTSAVNNNGTYQDCPLGKLDDATYSSLRIRNTSLLEGYSWGQVAALKDYLVIDGMVLNMAPYIQANPTAIKGDVVDSVIRTVLSNQTQSGKDATRLFYNRKVAQDAIKCMQSRYLAGRIDKIAPGCFVASLFLYVSLFVILAVVLVRFAMACIFNWFLSAKLVLPPKDLGRTAISPAVMPEGANVSVHNKTGTAPWANGGGSPNKKLMKNGKKINGLPNSSSTTLVNGVSNPDPLISLARIGTELFTVCLVTCYSEGEDSIRGTIESIAATNYSDSRKLIWVVCDGMITGHGEKMSTPDICVAMLDADPRFGNPMPMGFIAVGSGAKRENRAMVYAGHYVSKNGHRTPTIVVVKCGMPSEAKDSKPGNRGKRDSQLILMNFFSRVTYNDRMSPLDYDIFRKVQTLTGVTPDFFETVLMVDADTKIYPDSLKHLVNCMHHDNMIMGVCGETRIANKRQSWVTAIQVFEYFISHHNVKAFESVFGGVTCLPGCFSMYRIKARKDTDNDWVPILVKPEIVAEYSQSVVETLHQKNLLLLGEDRFLSTIMLRTFPRRKNIFLPQAKCRTVAPDTFSVLLSQRRRWINSTVHNLMELVRVRNLCGTFCFSMQFVVFMDLVGTVVLPVAICLTGALIVNSIITPPKSFQEAIPLMLLAIVLGLPAILILITTRKVIYVAWMVCYLFALPIWNFVLPVYSFWHFDDFSWGETRRVEGEVRSKGHDDKTAVFDGTTIPLRRWEDWEKSRLRKLRREEKRRKDMERQFGQGFHNDSDGLGVAPRGGWTRSEYESDSGSVFGSEEDVWGAEIGGYNEHNPAFPPPPIALPPQTSFEHGGLGGAGGGQTLGMDEMAAILDSGFDDQPPPPTFRPHANNVPSPLHRHQHDFQTPELQQIPTSAGGESVSSSIESRPHGGGHAKKRSAGGSGVNAVQNRYGPMGPLADEVGYTTRGGGGGFKGRKI
ncbi:chitin synthase 1 [Kwoniella shandongensis]|uniref:chitin synthase n=1 Tax=Kwoniella shandongensis TaxID=1734106 RepID=A0A5M6BXF7_9TREE|nr:chitin synthase 1 [Kwoniella shandongensis]KAA5527403.1 chitin synthase 1 [Kwoniella shandongensis]